MSPSRHRSMTCPSATPEPEAVLELDEVTKVYGASRR